MIAHSALSYLSLAGPAFLRVPWRWPALVLLVFAMVPHATAQGDEPGTATVLSFNTTAGVTNYIGAGLACTNGTLNGPYAMTGATSSTLGGTPACGDFFTLPPSAPSPAADVWFRFTPGANQRFRVTLIGSGGTPLNDGAMAIYESPNALGTGPFRLIECARGGSPLSGSAAQPTLEAACFTAGSTLYLRVWDETSRPATNRQFHLCVQGQTFTSPAAPAPPAPSSGNRLTHYNGTTAAPGETPCHTLPTIVPQAGNTAADYTKVEYVFACNETPWLFADNSEYVGGDLWVRMALNAVPRGSASIFAYQGSSYTANTIGITAYTFTNCADPTTFREVGGWSGTLGSTPPALPLFTMNCLDNATSNNFLYLRIHSVKSAQNSTSRYGQINIRWNRAADATGHQANYQPCGATQLSFSGSCPLVGTTPQFDNFLVNCSTPGIPAPDCGGFDANRRSAWYYFIAPPTGTVHIEASGAGPFAGNPAMALYASGASTLSAGCSGRLTLLECDDRHGVGDGAAIIRNGLTPGQVYYVRVWTEVDQNRQFTLCINEPTLPPGHCFYVVDLYAEGILASGPTTHQGVQYTINGGSPVDLVTSPIGGEASQLFLVAVPAGATFYMQYFNSDAGAYIRQVYQLGDTTRQWRYHGNIPVFGPQPVPAMDYTIAPACRTWPAYSNDCLGPKTICMTSPATTITGLYVENAPTPGRDFDLNAINMGCLGLEDKGISWLAFRPTQSGTIAFNIEPGAVDLDFAIWDTGLLNGATEVIPNISASRCAPNSAPL
ncbi:MAG: hypothetical protein KF797_14475, partial [Flavobacteriales bacterium]|nr:hypothetical protein [Flavobacteriales bacterium]